MFMLRPTSLYLQHSSSRGSHSSRGYPPSSGHDHRQHQHHPYHHGASIRSAPHPHMHHQLHPSHPIAHAAVAANTSTTILPHLLSWQTSHQSFNTYPWRVQNSVPFFTFPSTPPQYLPANSYPYTFAPRPAAPFPMQPVVTHAVPVPMSNEHVPVAVTIGNPTPVNVPPNAVAVSVNVIQQPVIHGPTQTQEVVSPASQDVTVIHSLGHTHQHFQATHLSAAAHPFVQADGGVLQNRPPVESYVALPNAAHVISLEQPRMNLSMTMNPSTHTIHPHASHRPDTNRSAESARASSMWLRADNGPGPSSRHQPMSGIPSPSDSSDSSPSSASSSPRESFSSIFYQASDSDTVDTPTLVDSPSGIFRGNMRGDISFTSTGNDSEHTALQTLADAAMSLTNSPVSQGNASEHAQGDSSERGPLRLPVLINISDSEPDSSVTTPSSIIDLTSSPTTSSSLLPSTPSDQQSDIASSPESSPSDGLAPPVLVPVIHRRAPYETGIRNPAQTSGSRRVLSFVSARSDQDETLNHQHQQALFAHPDLAHSQGVPQPHQLTAHSGGLLASGPQAVLRGTVLNTAHHTQQQHHPIVAAVGPPNALTPAVATIPAGNVQVLGWQPTFEPSHGQPHVPAQSVSEVPMGGHLNILVPPSAVPGQAYPPSHLPTIIQPRGEFWDTVMVSVCVLTNVCCASLCNILTISSLSKYGRTSIFRFQKFGWG